MAAGALGRRAPTDFVHVERYPLAALPSTEIAPKAIAWGVNWYREFDRPVLDPKTGRWWVARDGKLTSIRGGHCVCSPVNVKKDWNSWWRFYDQGSEGACVGFGCSRMMSLHNGRRYYARWLWDHAKLIDGWPDTNPGDDEGTSVRAACDVLRLEGHVRWSLAFALDDVQQRDARPALPGDGIQAVRWATSFQEVLDALDRPLYRLLGAVPFLNSWGTDYPHAVWVTGEVWERLIAEDGEVAVPTDR